MLGRARGILGQPVTPNAAVIPSAARNPRRPGLRGCSGLNAAPAGPVGESQVCQSLVVGYHFSVPVPSVFRLLRRQGLTDN